MKFYFSFILLIFISNSSIVSQTLLTHLLFEESHTVFKGQLIDVEYESSNAEGSSFTIALKVEKYFKGASNYSKIKIGLDKLDVIDLKLDTVYMDYDIQLDRKNPYFFFASKLTKSIQEGVGYGKFVSRIEGIEYSKNLEQLFSSFDITRGVIRKGATSLAFDMMSSNAEQTIVGKVTSIKNRKGKYQVKVKTSTSEKIIVSSHLNSVGTEGEIKIGKDYLFYVQEEKNKHLYPMDDYIGVLEATMGDKLRYRNK